MTQLVIISKYFGIRSAIYIKREVYMNYFRFLRALVKAGVRGRLHNKKVNVNFNYYKESVLELDGRE